MLIYVLRHGETDANKEGVLQGWLDKPLNAFGKELAFETAKGLNDIKFDICFSSPLLRAKQTAEIILKYTNNNCLIIYDERLKEINFGDWEKISTKKPPRLHQKIKLDLFYLIPKWLTPFPHGENVNGVIKRATTFLDELTTKDYQNVLISTHGCTARAIINSLLDKPNDFWQGHPPYNCAISILEYKNGQLKLLDFDKIFYDQKYLQYFIERKRG